MNILRIRNVHRALPTALELLKISGIRRDSRNGPTFQSFSPVTTLYLQPRERVLFWPERDANPFFHFVEALWMLGGKYDVATVAYFAKNMENYSDDGDSFWGSYGRRWRIHMPGVGKPLDQLPRIAQALKTDPLDRRQVLQMWDAESDLSRAGKDVPCNVTATFQVNCDGQLDMVVFNRSNDIIWGCYGANAVHFSALQEYVAFRSGYPVGTYTQVSVNWHGYEATFQPLYDKFLNTALDITPGTTDLGPVIMRSCPYEDGLVKPYPMISKGTDPDDWDANIHQLFKFKGKAPTEGRWADPFFTDVAIPILRAHDAYKTGVADARFENALKVLESCHASDWKMACSEWIMRRYAAFQRVHDDGPVP